MDKFRLLFNKTLVFLIIFFLFCMNIVTSTGNIKNDNFNFLDNNFYKLDLIGINDTTPPITNCTFDPPKPDGKNGWYLSNITVELFASDDLSGVREIRLSICGDPEIIIPGNYVYFYFVEDYKDYYIEYWAIDNAGNVETKKRFFINIDSSTPDFYFYFEVFNHRYIFPDYYFILSVEAYDSISGMDRVEFYMNNVYQETVFGFGPEYNWSWDLDIYNKIKGFILRSEFFEEFIKLFTLFVRADVMAPFPEFTVYIYDKAGNYDSDMINPSYPGKVYEFLLFQNLIIPNNYTGYIGNFFIDISIK